MFELKCRTRNNSNPKGKPRVYFCSHPDDFSYFEKISTAILKKYDVAIYHNTYASSDIDDLLLQLEQMQLIIIPVTKKFLSESNIALDIEFKYAIEKHIPILPIILELGLIDLYREKCGNTQYLDVVSNDETAISYEKKADELFSAVILNEEDIARIRSEFDAYIFLSYRKKDRVHSQKLMQLIHENDDLRDVAIWYDEFLLPGDDFKDEIDSALAKSDLFMLLVTPNLVNEENYVMKIEYPYAKSINKPIVAVEAVKTKASELKKFYTDIPKRVKSVDANILIEQILSRIDKISPVKDETPEHTYLIGLAYLKGIDVEVNVEKGLQMIFDAADRGCYDAIEEAIKIYLNGIGVEKNMEKVIYWKTRLMTYFEEKLPLIIANYPKDSEEYTKFFTDYFFEKIRYAMDYGKYLDLEKCDKLLAECEELLPYFYAADEFNYQPSTILEETIIKHLKRTSRINETLPHYEKLFELHKYLDLNNEGILAAHLENKIEYANVLRMFFRVDEAINVYKEVLEEYSFKRLSSILKPDDAYETWCNLHLELGTTYLLTTNQSNIVLVENCFKECLYYSKEYVKNVCTRMSIIKLASNYTQVANFAIIFRNYDVALKLLDDALEMVDNFDDESINDIRVKIKSGLYYKKVEVAKNQNNQELYMMCIKQSIELLNSDFNKLTPKEKIEKLLEIAERYKEHELVEEQLNTLLQTFDYDLEEYPMLESRISYEISEIYGNSKDYKNALKYVLNSLDKLECIKNTYKNFYYDMIVKCIIRLTSYYYNLGYDWIEIFTKYSFVFDIILDLPENSPFFYNSDIFDITYHYACTRLWNDDTFEEAEKLFLFCLKGYETLDENGIRSDHNAVAKVYCELYEYYTKIEDYDKALMSIKKGLEATDDNDKLYTARLSLYLKAMHYCVKTKTYEDLETVYNTAIEDIKVTIKKLYNLELENIGAIKYSEYLYEYLLLINFWTNNLIYNNEYKKALTELGKTTKFAANIEFNKKYLYRGYELSTTYMNIGICFLKINDYSMANTFLNLALRVLNLLEPNERNLERIKYIKGLM